MAVIADTQANDGKPPAQLGISHCSARIMAGRHEIPFSSVARIWRLWKIQPHRIETFKFPTGPALESKLRDVVGLHPCQQRWAWFRAGCLDSYSLERRSN